MKRIFPANVIESSIRLVGIDTFMGFINDKNIPSEAVLCAHLFQLVVSAAEID